MPGDSLPFAVFIGREPDVGDADGLDRLFELGNHLLLLGVNLVGGGEAIGDVDRWRAVLGLLDDTADVADAAEHHEVTTEVFLDGFGFGRALYDD